MPKPFSPTVLSFTILSLTDCGEPMQFENGGSKHVLAEDQQACDREMHTPGWAQYVKDAKGRVDPWQDCVELQRLAKGGSPAAASAAVKS